jgi:hypothetical protein
MNYKYGNDNFSKFYGANFMHIVNEKSIISLANCEYFIWTISDLNYKVTMDLINKIKIKRIFVIVDTTRDTTIDFNTINKIRNDLLFNLKHKTTTRNFFVIKTIEDWHIIKQVIDRVLLGFEVCGDWVFYVILALIFLLTGIGIVVNILYS